MKPTRVGVYMIKGTLLFIAVLSTILFATFLTQNAFAQEDGTEDPPTDPEYSYSQEVIEKQEPLSLFSPRLVTVTFVNENISGLTYAETVQDTLIDFELELNSKHVVKPDLDFVVTEDMHIRILEVVRKQYTEKESIPFTSVSVDDPEREIYTTAVKQVGRDGEKELTYEQVFINGILDSTKLLGEKVTVKPQEEIIAVGTKIMPSEDVSACKEMGSAYWTEYIKAMSASTEEKDWLLCVSACESGRNNCRVSYLGDYYGIMQYSVSSFNSAGGTSIWDGGEQLNFALAVYRAGRASYTWPGCHKMCTQ